MDELLISQFFDNYTHIKNNENDDRIIEVFENNKLEGYIFSTWDMVQSINHYFSFFIRIEKICII